MKRLITLLTATLATACGPLDAPETRSTSRGLAADPCALLGVDLVPDGDGVVVHGARDRECAAPVVAELLVEDEWPITGAELSQDPETGRFAGRLPFFEEPPLETPLTLRVQAGETEERIALVARHGEEGIELVAPVPQAPEDLNGTWLLSARQLGNATDAAPAYARIQQEGGWIEVTDLCDPERRIATGWADGEYVELFDVESGALLGAGSASPYHLQAFHEGEEAVDVLEAVRIDGYDCEAAFEGFAPVVATPFAPRMPVEQTLWTGLDPFNGYSVVEPMDGLVQKQLFWPNAFPGGVVIPASRPNGMDHLMAAAKTPWPVPKNTVTPQTQPKQCMDPANGYASIPCPASSQGTAPYQECVPRTMTGDDVVTLANRVLLTPDNDVYPGALLQGRTVDTGAFAPINVPRAGATITMVGPSMADPNVNLGEVTLANVEQARQTLIRRPIHSTAGRLAIQAEAVYSFNDLLVKAGAHVKWGAGDFQANFSFQQSATQNYVLVKFSQELYRLVASRPATAAAAFRDGRAFNDTDFHIGANNRPVFVSEVGYGRQLFLLVQSKHTTQDILASLKLAYSGNSASASAKHKQVLRESNINFVALGGDAALAAGPISNLQAGGDVFKAVVDTAANLKGLSASPTNAAVPVAFTLTDLLRGDKLRSAYSISHTRRDCVARDGRPFKTELVVRSINEGLDVWINPANTPKSGSPALQYSLIHPTWNGYGAPVTSDLTPRLTGGGAQRITFEHHNSGCFYRWADFALRIDGVDKFSHRLPHSGWGHCGTYMRAHMDVDPATGSFSLGSYQN